MSTYYNTTGRVGADLKGAQAQAMSQDELVYLFLFKNRGKWYRADDVHKHLRKQGIIDKKVPYISIRRACTNLFKASQKDPAARPFEKSEWTVKGYFVSPVHQYRIPPIQQPLFN